LSRIIVTALREMNELYFPKRGGTGKFNEIFKEAKKRAASLDARKMNGEE